jgi:uridylate kinase
MAQQQSRLAVISVGGSLIVPDGIGLAFLEDFRDRIKKYVREGWRFAIITGGGKIARQYQEALGKSAAKEDLDWIGIRATHLNAYLVQALLGESAGESVVEDPTAPLPDKPVIVAGGWKPGRSTDYDAVLIAQQLGAGRIINLSNVDYVYTADPKKNPDAKPIEKITWEELRKLLPPEWDPGLSTPFDPVAAKEAEALGLEVAIMNGAHLDQVENYLDGKPFRGTTITP